MKHTNSLNHKNAQEKSKILLRMKFFMSNSGYEQSITLILDQNNRNGIKNAQIV